MYQVLIVVYLIVAIALIGLVMVQNGKGASMGASFGAGASNTVFGSSGSGNFLTRATAILAIVFFIISLSLGAITGNKAKSADTWSNLSQPETQKTVEKTVKPETTTPVTTNKNTDVPE